MSAISMLSCAKLGIHFSVVFEDLAEHAIEKRIRIFKPDLIFSITKNKDLIKLFSEVSKVKKLKIIYFHDVRLEKNLSEKNYKKTKVKSGR